MDLLNSKIITTNADTLSQAQATGIYGFNTAENKLKATHVSDDNALKVAVSQHLVDGPDMKARTDIANPATSTFIKCNVDGTLEMTAELNSSNLAKEATLAAMNGKITKGSDATLVEAQQVGSYAMNESTNVWQPLSAHHSNKNLKTTDANIINGNQVSKIMGIDNTNTQQQIKVSTAGRIELDAYNLTSLSTANNQTNGTQVSKIMGSEDGATTGIQHQLKCDANGVLETSGGGGGGGDASAANQTNGNQLSKVMGIYTPTNTQVQLKAFVDGTLYVNNGFSTSHIGKADIDVTIPAGTAEAYLAPYTSMSIYSRAVIYGNTTNWNDKIYVSYGKTGAGTFYKDWENPINVDPSSGDFFRQLSGVCASWRLSKANTSNVEETIKILSTVSQGN